MSELTIKEKLDAMVRGDILRFRDGAVGFCDPEHVYGPFVVRCEGGREVRMNDYWHSPCTIEPKPRSQLMTRDQVLGFLAHCPEVVVAHLEQSYQPAGWIPLLADDSDIQYFCWAYQCLDGRRSEPQMFTTDAPDVYRKLKEAMNE